MSRGRIFFKTVTIVAMVTVLLCALWIMARRLGLAEGLDFGAGAYYYADIPDFDKVIRDDAYTTHIPFWVHAVLFLAWGALMYRLWIWLDRKGSKDHE